MAKAQKKGKIPGTIYKNGSRWWWKVQLPGTTKHKAYPLKPPGAKNATKEYHMAVECAHRMLAKAVFAAKSKLRQEVKTVAELSKVYADHADEYYTGFDGGRSKEALNVRYSLKVLVAMYGAERLEEFGPLKLMKVRERLIDMGYTRGCINQRISRVKRMFKWAVSRQLVPVFVYQSLATIGGLRRGRSHAKEGKKIRPVDEKHVYMILDYTTPVISAMVELQMLTGMRPGELVQMRPKDIDRSGDVWHYYPEKHKNEFRDHERIVPIGPRGQKILEPVMQRAEDAYCFCPAESEECRRQRNSKNRKTPLSYGNRRGTNRRANPQMKPGDYYDTNSYRKAVESAIRACREAIKDRGGDPETELPKWTPHRLRHTAATKARKLFNYETAGALLGHSNMSATAIYAERNQGLADEAARQLG